MRVVRDFTDIIRAVFVFVRVIMVAEANPADVEQRFRPLYLLQQLRVPIGGTERLRSHPRDKRVFDAELVEIREVCLDLSRADVRGNGRQAVLLQKFSDLRGRFSVKSRELHAVVPRFGNGLKDCLRALALRHFAQTVKLNRKFHGFSFTPTTYSCCSA